MKENISPYSGKKMELKRENDVFTFKGETYKRVYEYYWCEDSQSEITTEEQSDRNMIQVYNQYRERHNLPYPEEIMTIRNQYGLTATKMSEVLGFGVNGYRNYETGDIPSKSNATLIKVAADPNQFKNIALNSDALVGNLRERLLKKIDKLIEEEKTNIEWKYIESYLTGANRASSETGFKTSNLRKFTEMVAFFVEFNQPFKTKLNKLMFYADFLNFKRHGYSISGMKYRAISYGIVPATYERLYDYAVQNEIIHFKNIVYADNHTGEQYVNNPNTSFERELFSEHELQTMNDVLEKFKDVSTREIIEMNHEEEAWKMNCEDKAIVDYFEFGHKLSQID